MQQSFERLGQNRTFEFENWLFIFVNVFYWNIFIFQFSGLGQDSSTYLNLGSYSSLSVYPIRDSFKRAGFANATLGNDKLLPCSLGAFVNVSRLECVECPAGKIYIVFDDYSIIIHSTQYLLSDWPRVYSELSKSVSGTSYSCRLYNNHGKDTQGHR